MAISRRDQRKNLEEAESNTIGTEYLWADLLAPADRAKVRELLKKMPRGPSRSGADKRGRISRLPRRARRFCRRSPRSWRFAATEKRKLGEALKNRDALAEKMKRRSRMRRSWRASGAKVGAVITTARHSVMCPQPLARWAGERRAAQRRRVGHRGRPSPAASVAGTSVPHTPQIARHSTGGGCAQHAARLARLAAECHRSTLALRRQGVRAASSGFMVSPVA
jgi:hypothetical protein